MTMTITKKRSRSDFEARESIDIQLPIQVHTRPATPVEMDDIYNMQVLSLDFGRTEQDLDQQFLVTALNLGITVPQDPKTTFDRLSNTFSALTLSSNHPDSVRSLPRTSESTNPPSCTSSQQQLPSTKASSQITSPVPSTPASVTSASSDTKQSSYLKIRKGLRRLSTMTRRRTSSSIIPTLATFSQPGSALATSRPGQRPATADSARPASFISMRSEFAPRTSLSLPEQRQTTNYRPMTPPPEEQETEDLWSARERSIKNHRLQKLRAHQLEEQSRFLRFEQEQHRLIHLKASEAKRSITDRYHQKHHDLTARHADLNSDLEHRHLSAEVDLVRALQQQRRACESRLRHMEAYCNGRTAGMPVRNVTVEDHKKLAQQRHERNGLYNLHSARVNVLREQQAKQIERVAAKQAAEIAHAVKEMERELAQCEAEAEREERDLRTDLAERRGRIVSRWRLVEAIERQKLDNQTGEQHGPLPGIVWPADEVEEQERPMLGKQAFWKAAVVFAPMRSAAERDAGESERFMPSECNAAAALNASFLA